MQRPLDAHQLLALVDDGVLVDDGIDVGTAYITFLKRHFAEQNVSAGVLNLILAFGLFRPYLCIQCETWENYGPDRWRINFLDRPFTHLSVRPDPDRRAFVEVYEDDKHLKTYEMLGHPEHWQTFINWLWNYGNDRLIRRAAIETIRKASRRHSNSQIPFDPSRTISRQKVAAEKQRPDPTLHRLLRPKNFKAQSSKSKGKTKPSNLGLASLTLADMEGKPGEDQILQDKDPNRRTATASPSSVDDVTGLKVPNHDVRMAGAE